MNTYDVTLQHRYTEQTETVRVTSKSPMRAIRDACTQTRITFQDSLELIVKNCKQVNAQ